MGWKQIPNTLTLPELIDLLNTRMPTQGATGPTGPTGPVGPTGPTGPTGP